MATLLAGPAPVVSEQEAMVPWPQGGDTAGETASQMLTDECSGGFFLSDEVAVTGESRWSGRVTSEGCWGASKGQGITPYPPVTLRGLKCALCEPGFRDPKAETEWCLSAS